MTSCITSYWDLGPKRCNVSEPYCNGYVHGKQIGGCGDTPESCDGGPRSLHVPKNKRCTVNTPFCMQRRCGGAPDQCMADHGASEVCCGKDIKTLEKESPDHTDPSSFSWEMRGGESGWVKLEDGVDHAYECPAENPFCSGFDPKSKQWGKCQKTRPLPPTSDMSREQTQRSTLISSLLQTLSATPSTATKVGQKNKMVLIAVAVCAMLILFVGVSMMRRQPYPPPYYRGARSMTDDDR